MKVWFIIKGEIIMLMVVIDVSMFCSFFCVLLGMMCDMMFCRVGRLIEVSVVIGVKVRINMLLGIKLMKSMVNILRLRLKIIVL